MKKNEFIELVQQTGQYTTKIDAEKAIDAFTSAVTSALSMGESVSLLGFGSFEASLQKGKTGKVPGTDRTYTTEDKMVPKFKAGKSLKDNVASGR